MLAAPVPPDTAARVAERMRRLVATEPADRASALALAHLATAGKGLRAGVAYEATRALGGSDEAAIAWATACELLHEASLVHDDIEDGDLTRRGAPTMWASHGMAQALNLGDLLIVAASSAVAEVPSDDGVRWRLAHALALHAGRAIRAQAHDLDPQHGIREPWASWERAAVDKAGALFALPVHGAVLIAGGSPSEATAAAAPFGRLGVLYQIQDDVADLYGDKGLGRFGSDVRGGKVTALVAQHLERWPEEAVWIDAVLRSPDRVTDATVHAVRQRFRDRGTVHALLDRACGLSRDLLAIDPHSPLRTIAADLFRRALRPLRDLDARPTSD